MVSSTVVFYLWQLGESTFGTFVTIGLFPTVYCCVLRLYVMSSSNLLDRVCRYLSRTHRIIVALPGLAIVICLPVQYQDISES